MKFKRRLDSMLRVNQAGEYGAIRIYEGQLSVLKGSASQTLIEHMKTQEEHHYATFTKKVIEGRVRPTLLQPLWHVGGFAMGAITARLGEKAAMACTVAVESVIDAHYADQLVELGDQDPELTATIEKFREEELEHKETALKEGAEEAIAYPMVSGAVRGMTSFAIWLSKRI